MFEPSTAIYTPADAARYAANQIEIAQKQKGSGMTIPLEGIVDYFAPMSSNQILTVIAQTSNYKSGFMHWMARQEALRAMDRMKGNEIIVHVSVEECVEEQIYLSLARECGQDAASLARGEVQDWNRLEEACIRVGEIPIYRIGDSIARSDNLPLLHLSNMMKSIELIASGEFFATPPKIIAIFFDYLQAFPLDTEVSRQTDMSSQRRMQVRADIFRLRQCSSKYGCPVIVGVQAKQNLAGANPPYMIPGIYDGEESSAIAQRADRIVQLWLPKMTHRVGETIGSGDGMFSVEEDLLFIKVGKQRGGYPSGKSWPARIDYKRNEISTVPWSSLR